MSRTIGPEVKFLRSGCCYLICQVCGAFGKLRDEWIEHCRRGHILCPQECGRYHPLNRGKEPIYASCHRMCSCGWPKSLHQFGFICEAQKPDSELSDESA